MAVAYFMVHAPRGFWPIVNEGELAVLYSFVFLYVATRGSGGAYSLDSVLRRGGRAPATLPGRRAAAL
jgi:putative oxidoreductase